MDDLNILSNLIVKVEGGSGCLFQPADASYSYVLTAKHVIKDNVSPKIIRQRLDDAGVIINDKFEIIGSPFFHKDPNKDTVIIKIQKVEGIELLIRGEAKLDNGCIYYLAGHPSSRMANKYSFRSDKLKINNKTQFGYIEATLEQSIIKSEVNGQSGGGIIKIDNSCFFLAGIQARMAVDETKENLSRIEFMPISFFDEIIYENRSNLSALIPSYILSFERLLCEIFPLSNMLGKKKLIQNELSVIAKDICKVFSPSLIIQEFGDVFLIDGTDKAMIYHKQLWVAFLELLAINQLHCENKLSINELKEIHKKRKLFFADTCEWVTILEDIYKTDLSEIEKGGCIVIATTNDIRPTMVEIPKEFIGDISAIPCSQMTISNTVTNPLEDLRIVHIYKFQRHIIDNVKAFAKITNVNSKETLKHETTGII